MYSSENMFHSLTPTLSSAPAIWRICTHTHSTLDIFYYSWYNLHFLYIFISRSKCYPRTACSVSPDRNKTFLAGELSLVNAFQLHIHSHAAHPKYTRSQCGFEEILDLFACCRIPLDISFKTFLDGMWLFFGDYYILDECEIFRKFMRAGAVTEHFTDRRDWRDLCHSSRLQFLFPADRMRIRLGLREGKKKGKREKGRGEAEDQDEQKQKARREKRWRESRRRARNYHLRWRRAAFWQIAALH